MVRGVVVSRLRVGCVRRSGVRRTGVQRSCGGVGG
jgi:hypothetical protein